MAAGTDCFGVVSGDLYCFDAVAGAQAEPDGVCRRDGHDRSSGLPYVQACCSRRVADREGDACAVRIGRAAVDGYASGRICRDDC